MKTLGSWPQGTRAFTMMELLVAAAITVMLAGILLTVVVNIVNAWGRTHGILVTESQARLALDYLTRDLQGAVVNVDGRSWLAVSIQENSGESGMWISARERGKSSRLNVGETADVENLRFGLAGAYLGLITAESQLELNAGGPVAVSYQLIRGVPLGASEESDARYQLYRTEASAEESFRGGYSFTALNERLRRPKKSEVLADHVIDFGLRLYRRNPNGGSTLIFPREGGNLSFETAVKDPPSSWPDEAEIVIRLLSSEGARRISALESGQVDGDWWAIAEKDSKVFVKRVQVIARPLSP